MQILWLAIAAAIVVAIVLRGKALGWRQFVSILMSEVGAVTLAQSAPLSEDDLQRGVIETFIYESFVLDRIPLLPIEGNAYAYNEELTLPGAAFRAVNTAYTESTGTVLQRTETLSILGGDADVDTFIQQTRSNLNDQRAIQTTLKVKAAVIQYQDAFINGDNTANPEEFDGLVNRLAGAQVVETAVNGLFVVGASEANQQTFLDRLDDMLDQVTGGADALYMARGIRLRLRQSARRLQYWERDRDEFGRVVEFYNGIPMLILGDDLAGTAILPQTETVGSSTDCSSIYGVHFTGNEAEAGVTAVNNGGIQVKDLGEIDASPVFRTRIELFIGLAVFGLGAARLTGVRDG